MPHSDKRISKRPRSGECPKGNLRWQEQLGDSEGAKKSEVAAREILEKSKIMEKDEWMGL